MIFYRARTFVKSTQRLAREKNTIFAIFNFKNISLLSKGETLKGRGIFYEK